MTPAHPEAGEGPKRGPQPPHSPDQLLPGHLPAASDEPVPEWWEVRLPQQASQADDAIRDDEQRLSPELEEALRQKARRREAQMSAPQNPLLHNDRRSGDLEGLVRIRGDVDTVVPKKAERNLLWPVVSATFVLAAAAAAVGIPIYLNALEMERITREAAENPPNLQKEIPAVLEEIGVTLSKDAEARRPNDTPSPTELEAAEQRPFTSLIERADAAAYRGDLEAMRRVVEDTIEAAPDRADVLLLVAASLGTGSSSLSDSSRATFRSILRPLYERAADAAAGVPDLLQRCGDFFAANGEPDRATELYQRAAELLPSGDPAAAMKALRFLEKSGSTEAIAALTGMVQRQPENRAVRANLARLLIANKQPADALPHLEAARKSDPEDPVMLLRHLRALIDLELWQAALDEVALVSEQLRQRPAVRFLAAQAAFRLGRTDEAMAEFRDLAKLVPPGGPELAPGLFAYTYGVAAMLKGDNALALSQFETAAAQSPNGLPEAHNNLAWLLVQQGGDPARAVAAARKAVQIQPSNGVFSDTLARALLAAGKRAEAVEQSRAAIRLAGNSAVGEMFETLGDALAASGQRLEAEEAYARALALGLPNPNKVKAKLRATHKAR